MPEVPRPLPCQRLLNEGALAVVLALLEHLGDDGAAQVRDIGRVFRGAGARVEGLPREGASGLSRPVVGPWGRR